jgi:predicted nucleic acid-binding protein
MKTYVFDASALLGFLQKAAGALKVGELLKEATRGRATVLMSAVNYGEVYGCVLRGRGPEQATAAINAVRSLPVSCVDVTPIDAISAAEIKAKYKLYYVDSFAAALAMKNKATLVTSDSDFRCLGHKFPVVWVKP